MAHFQKYQVLPPYTTDRSAGGEMLIWLGREPVPEIGSDVYLRVNGIGVCQVVGYASEGRYLGVMAFPYNPPEWWIEANGTPGPERVSLAFGAEISAVEG